MGTCSGFLCEIVLVLIFLPSGQNQWDHTKFYPDAQPVAYFNTMKECYSYTSEKEIRIEEIYTEKDKEEEKRFVYSCSQVDFD